MKKIAALLFMCFLLVACGPPQLEQYKEIQPHETAFVVALEGAQGDQVRFDSADAVKKLRVASRRVPIPTRKKDTGRAPGAYEWIPTVQVITVDRSPITREWSQSEAGNQANNAEAIYVESKESIGFSMAVTVTCSIKEENAHLFLYWYGGKPLSSVIDQNIRSVVASEMARRFGSMALNDCREKKGEVFEAIRQIVSAEFEPKGITLLSFGNSGGLVYENSEIQVTMNREFMSQNELRIAQNQFQADEVKRKNTLADAENERKKAEEFAKAQQAAEAKQTLSIMANVVEKWNGDVPRFLIIGEGAKVPQLLMDISEVEASTP
jgi:hypothetical protein